MQASGAPVTEDTRKTIVSTIGGLHIFMPELWWKQNRRIGSAFALSMLLHAMLWLVFAHLTPNLPNAPEAIQTISFQKIQHVSVRQQHAVQALPAASASRTAALRPANKPQRQHPQKVAVHPGRRPSRKAPTQTSTSPQVVTAQASGVPSPGPAASPVARATQPAQTAKPATQTDQAQHVAAANGSAESGGRAPFLAQEDPHLELSVLQTLKQRYKMHVTLTVAVSEDGRTGTIEFQPSVSDDIRKQITDLLAAARWTAALCGGGIGCEGKAKINLWE
ncbi:MAG: hypothetical protein M3N19_07360 [Candidatus Eremiobacteraeota bacterium]|nr:hypothetical protein [Candidatus Eremiobacteraeota bacterium]